MIYRNAQRLEGANTLMFLKQMFQTSQFVLSAELFQCLITAIIVQSEISIALIAV